MIHKLLSEYINDIATMPSGGCLKGNIVDANRNIIVVITVEQDPVMKTNEITEDSVNEFIESIPSILEDRSPDNATESVFRDVLKYINDYPSWTAHLVTTAQTVDAPATVGIHFNTAIPNGDRIGIVAIIPKHRLSARAMSVLDKSLT